MAPFRSSARSNRTTGRGQAEQDVFAGLPVRQWRQGEGVFGLPPPETMEQDKDLIYPELPMPRDASQLALHTQLLLREARKPRSAKRKAEAVVEIKVDEDDENRENQVSRGWSGKKWSQVPANLEEPDPEYLAKRRKGLTSTYVEAPAFVPQIATRTAKVRKFDANGQQVVYEVVVPEGQTIEGEVKDEDVSMLAAPVLAPGTVIEGVGVANAEGQVIANDLLQPAASRRRKPPPPKRKGGPGRGKKKVMFQRPATDAAAAPTGDATPTTATDGQTPSAFNATADGDEEEGEEGEEGEDGEDGEDDDREDGELSDGEVAEPEAATEPTAAVPVADSTLTADVAMPDADPAPPTVVPAEEAAAADPLPVPAQTEGLAEPTHTPAEPSVPTTDAVPAAAVDSELEALQKTDVAEPAEAMDVSEPAVEPAAELVAEAAEEPAAAEPAPVEEVTTAPAAAEEAATQPVDLPEEATETPAETAPQDTAPGASDEATNVPAAETEETSAPAANEPEVPPTEEPAT